MGDGFYDKQIIKNCSYGICPKNARLEAKKAANFITPNNGGEGAVFDACKHILKKVFQNRFRKMSRIAIFANFLIDSEERFLRMKRFFFFHSQRQI